MEGRTQLTSPSQLPAKLNRKDLIILLILILCLITGGIYVVRLNMRQAETAKMISNSFSELMKNNEYLEAYRLLESLDSKGLGNHLQKTRESINNMLDIEIEAIAFDLLNEEGSEFKTLKQVNEIQVFRNNTRAKEAFAYEAKKASEGYLTGDIHYDQIQYYFLNLLMLGFSGSELEGTRSVVESARKAREKTRSGWQAADQGDYLEAISMFKQVTNEDQKNYATAQEGLDQSLSRLNARVDMLEKWGQYVEAEDQLSRLKELFPENQVIEKRIASLELARKEEEKNLILYDGPVQHIFFHPLIAFPELTFDGDYQERGFNEWFVTVPEFKKMIESIYAKGFILIDFDDLYEIEKVNDQETLVAKPLLLPKGKKPMILSVDDVNYYRYMIQNGTVHKLIIGEDGKIATYTKRPSGEELISYNNEIIPILDSFADEHPDFSFHGAKGVIALTGYEGILGYRTDELESPDVEKEKDEALRVVQALKDSGWSFACHGYGHLNTREDTYGRIVEDTARWQKEVESLIGHTDIFIYPFGASVKPDDLKFKQLQKAGFKVFCSVGPNPYLKFSDQYILMDRRHLDGIALFWQADSLRDLFESQDVIDPVRPILLSNIQSLTG